MKTITIVGSISVVCETQAEYDEVIVRLSEAVGMLSNVQGDSGARTVTADLNAEVTE